MSPLHNIIKPFIKNINNYPNINIKDIKSDSTKVKKGDLFIAISGKKFDGHDFINQAINSGASAIISNGRDLGQLPVPQIKVKNSRIAVSKIAAQFYGNPSKNLK